MQCVLLNGEDLSCYSNKMESISFRKCPHDHRLTSKAYLSAVAVSDIYRSFYLQDGDKNQLRRYGTKLRHCRPTRFCLFCVGSDVEPRLNQSMPAGSLAPRSGLSCSQFWSARKHPIYRISRRFTRTGARVEVSARRSATLPGRPLCGVSSLE